MKPPSLKVLSILILWSIFISCSKNKLAVSFEEIPSGTEYELHSIFFVTQQIGFVTGGEKYKKGIVLKTINGGNSWSTIYSSIDYPLKAVSFINADTGVVVGGIKTILRTIDGGANWQSSEVLYSEEAFANTYLDFNSIYLAASNNGIIVGGDGYENGIILKTSNAGLSWLDITKQACPNCRYTSSKHKELLNYNLQSVSFSDANTGFIAGYGIILKTIDAGNNWFPQPAPTGGFFRSVFFENNTGFIAGYNGVILKTDDGLKWNKLKSGSTVFSKIKYLESICFVSNETGYVAGDGILLKTTDGGKSWLKNDKINYSLNSIFFTNVNTGYAVGKAGIILKLNE